MGQDGRVSKHVVSNFVRCAVLKDTLRRRFGNCLLWYSSLTNAVNRHVQGHLDVSRGALCPLATVGESNGNCGDGKHPYMYMYDASV